MWCRPAATALSQPLAWELAYAVGMALKRYKKKHLCLFLIENKLKKKQINKELENTQQLTEKKNLALTFILTSLIFMYLSFLIDGLIC